MGIHAIAIRLKQLATPAAPSSGENLLYFKSDGKLYKQGSDGVEVLVEASGSSSPLAAWPVGSIFMSVVSTNPATLLGGGTWAAWGTGRVPVGIDTSQTEFNTVEEVGGEKTHTLTAGEMPSHVHALTRSSTTGTSGTTVVRGGASDVGGTTTDTRGSDGAHNNLQPYIVCYMWKRTA